MIIIITNHMQPKKQVVFLEIVKDMKHYETPSDYYQ